MIYGPEDMPEDLIPKLDVPDRRFHKLEKEPLWLEAWRTERAYRATRAVARFHRTLRRGLEDSRQDDDPGAEPMVAAPGES